VVFLTLTEVSPCFFLSCKANARVKLAKTGHGPHSSTLVVICIVWFLFVLFCVLFVCKCVLPPGDNPIAVNKYIILYQPAGAVITHRICSLQHLIIDAMLQDKEQAHGVLHQVDLTSYMEKNMEVEVSTTQSVHKNT
jgi:hypothetical protein